MIRYGSAFWLSESHPAYTSVVSFLGGFEILVPLHQGAFTAVYRARKEDRVVALKVLTEKSNGDPLHLLRFRNEGEALRRFDHEGIVRWIDSGEDHGRRYMALECVDGPSWAKTIRKRAFTHRESASIAARVARALHHAHGRGVIHADLTPSNVLLCPDGAPKLIDFGICHARDLEPVPLPAGATAGTPVYMSPEQATGGSLDARTDVYSLGASLYEATTTRTPFRGSNTLEILRRIEKEEPVRPRALDPSIHPGLEVCILRAMEKDPELRYASAEEFAEDLQGWIRAVPDWFSIVPFS